MATNVAGTVYLLHIEPPYKHAGHYLGWVQGDVAARIATHVAGQGSPLIKAALAAGHTVTLARTWQGVDRHFERKLKNRGSSTRHCPLCAEKWAGILQAQAERRDEIARLHAGAF